MNTKEKCITFLWVVIVMALFAVDMNFRKNNTVASSVYAVYLQGKTIGYIENESELYSIINNKQREIKDKYSVDNVYPPEDFEIVKTRGYKYNVSTPSEVYDKMAKVDTFTIEGYIVTVTPGKDAEDKKPFTINVLTKDIFDKAIQNFISAFVDSSTYTNYINNTQKEIETTGKIIELMYFDENITIRKGYMPVNETLFIDVQSLSQYLLFGKDYKLNSYTVKSGDTIESIAEEHKLNYKELLMVNPKYTSKDSLLRVGEKINVTLINPVLTFSYDVKEVSDQTIIFDEKIVYDNTKDPNYSEITTPGVNGITRSTTKYIVKNGITEQGALIIDSTVITEKVNQVVTKGRRYSGGTVTGHYVDNGQKWGWPTNQPYVLTSYLGWRTLRGIPDYHTGLDISGTGYGSPIYAALDGTVYSAGWEGKCGRGGGYCVLIAHADDIYTTYAHMAPGSIKVREGQAVSKGEIIGAMGASGNVTGTHLHFAVSKGAPFYSPGYYFINPLSLYR